MGTKHFGDNTSWGVWDRKGGNEGWSEPGWAMPSDHSRYIGRDDPYWGRVLDHARQAYGDPNIHYSTDNAGNERHLVFGDGTRLPDNGTIVYHDSGTNQTWAQNDDGTVSLLDSDGQQGPPTAPAGYRKVGDHYAPVNANGQQIGPQLGGVPGSDNGFHTDPKTGLLTPKNLNGDYYTLGPDGKKAFFDKNGTPISEDQFNNANKPREPAGPQPDDGGLTTEEQQSGKAADAVKKLQNQLHNHYTKISDAEEKLSEVLLNAHATNSAGQQKLNDIQKKIVDAVNDPTMEMDTPTGERVFLTFLRNQVAAVNELVADGSLSAQDQSKAAHALAALYAVDTRAGTTDDSPKPADPSAGQPSASTADPAPAVADPAPAVAPDMADPGIADPGLSDMLGGGPLGSDPLSSLASMLPALGGLGGAAGNPLDSLGDLAGAASPLAGLASGLGDQGNHEHPSDTTDKADDSPEHAKDSKDAKADATKTDTTTSPDAAQTAAGQQAQNAGNSTAGDPPSPAAAPAPASPTVTLPDGSTATARNPQTAQAIRDYLAGKTVDAAYRQNNIQLPPPGTPVTNPVDPSRLACGDLAMFKDHYVPVLSPVKAFVNGQVVPLESVSSSPDFLGWIDPTAAAASPHTGPPAAPQPAAPPVAATSPPAPAPPLAAAAAMPGGG